MGNLERLAIGVSSIGGVTGIGVFLNKSLYTDSIRSKLLANKFEILNNKDQYGHWEKILEVYKEIEKQQDKKFKFSETGITTTKQLQDQCEKILGKRVGESDDGNNNYYDKAKRWCTIPTSVAKELEKNRRLLNTKKEEKEEIDKEEWDKKIKEYTAKTNKDKIEGLKLIEPEKPITNVEKQHREAIKEKCKYFNEKQSYEEGYEKDLENSRTWCTVEKKPIENK